MNPQFRFVRLAVLTILLLPALTAQPVMQDVLIRSKKPYGPLITAIESKGGVVTRQYKYIDAVAARVPVSALTSIGAMLPSGAMTKDLVVPAPAPLTRLGRDMAQDGMLELAADSFEPVSDADWAAHTSDPNSYRINNELMAVSEIHAAGIRGQGVIVAVIDSGIRPAFQHLSASGGSVVGGEDFVGDGYGYSNNSNGGHGTFVAGMISAKVTFVFSENSGTRKAILAECPTCFSDPPAYTRVPMFGTAPDAGIFALRVFGPTGGAPTSTVLAAVERVIELRELFDAGDPQGVNIRVCNMSLGGATQFAGGDLFDTAVDALLAKDIVLVVSAGNSGPSSLTVGSPGTSLSALTVGAASTPHNERILRRLQYGEINGPLYRPFMGTQTAYFSARGPNADGRNSPDVTANGFACFGQGLGTLGTINWASGTSFAAPSVAGVAALLRQGFPAATARQVRNAIIMSARPDLLHDGSTELDRGAGFVNAAGAWELLQSGSVPDTVGALGNPSTNVKVNIEQGTFLDVHDGVVVESFNELLPGERHDILYRVLPNTKEIVVQLADVTTSLPPSQQNKLFGDDVRLAIHSAKTSAIGEGDYYVTEFTLGGTYVVPDPEPGIMRITVNGSWTNAGTISGKARISSSVDPMPRFSRQGKISDDEIVAVSLNVPAGVAELTFRLGWRESWASYPASDLDLVLVAPDGSTIMRGGTLANPEKVTVAKPLAGEWIALILGFEVYGQDKYELRVMADGTLLK